MTFKKNDHVTLAITDIGIHGEGIGKLDGFPLFVKNALPGDVAEVVITKVKSSYGYGKALAIREPSPDRVTPPCPVAERCGGCQLQALSYEKQLGYKQDLVRQRLIRIGGFDPKLIDQVMEPIRGMKEPWRYRNKAQYPVAAVDAPQGGRHAAAGFYAGRTHHLIENDDCLLEPEINSRILKAVLSFVNDRGISPYNEEKGTGILRHIMIRHGFGAKEILLCLIVRKYREQDWLGLPDALREHKLLPKEDGGGQDHLSAEGQLVSVGFSVQPEKNNVIMGKDCIPIYGKPYLTDRLGDVSYRISPQSFYQVNPVQMKVLYDLAEECAGLTGQETLWDLYCGIGTIGLYLAENAKKVIGVEVVPEAVENARENAQINHIDNAEYYTGTAEDVFQNLIHAAREGMPASDNQDPGGDQVVVVDPPRKGCDEKLLNAILNFSPERIVYVSCDPATLARDLKILCKEAYELKRVVPVDQFCHSCHVECVVLMSRVKD